jgi:phospholipid:diacylglycerol acyltransferase
MWGGIGTARQFFTERDCWREHLALDPLTGVDPEGIRLRSCQGFEAADYFAANYWVWSKLIENLADLGYDGSTMSMMSYDWRLAYPLVEKRDGYLTHLRHHIEAMHKTNGEKVVLAAHSMGSPLIVYFFKWITTDEADGGGGGGQDWVDEHIHAFVNIAGPMLGVPKATPALLSGEMRDTSLFVGVFGSMIEEFFGRRLRKDLWNTWGSLWAMLPKGGDQIWGIGADLCNSTSSCDGLWCKSTESQSTSMVPFLQLTDTETLDTREEKFYCEGDMKEQRQAKYLSHQIDEFSRRTNHSIEDTLLFLEKWGGGYGASLGNLQHNSLDQDERPSPRTWSDPSRTPLPHAPKLKIYCLYGVGLPTERAYFYQRNTVNAKQATADEQPKRCNNSHFDPPFIMNSSVSDAESNISYGVKFSDGDGSVPLLSMGYICVDAWKRKELNPSGSKVITREYYHSQEFHLGDPMRGGPHAADHVDILGNVDMTEDFLRVVSDHGAKKMKSNIVSDIMNITERINAHPNGGLYVKKAKQNPVETFLGLFNKK